MQLYSSNSLNASIKSYSTAIQRKKSQSYGSEKQYYRWRGAATLEAQHFPHFPSVVLRKGVQHTTYTFGTL